MICPSCNIEMEPVWDCDECQSCGKQIYDMEDGSKVLRNTDGTLEKIVAEVA